MNHLNEFQETLFLEINVELKLAHERVKERHPNECTGCLGRAQVIVSLTQALASGYTFEEVVDTVAKVYGIEIEALQVDECAQDLDLTKPAPDEPTVH